MAIVPRIEHKSATKKTLQRNSKLPSHDNDSTLRNLTWARIGHTATLLPNGKALIVGGNQGTAQRAEVYDSASATWCFTASFLDPGEKANHRCVWGGSTADLALLSEEQHGTAAQQG